MAGVAQLGEQQTEVRATFWRSRVQSTVLAFLSLLDGTATSIKLDVEDQCRDLFSLIVSFKGAV